MTPDGGLTMWFQLAATSFAVSVEPSENWTLWRIVKVQVRPPSVGSGMAVQTSQTKCVVSDGFSGSARISTL
jgi:hypothetical protein